MAMEAGCMPFMEAILKRDETGPHSRKWGLATTVMPTFTNPNNVAIITGVTPKVNGICGNYFFDPETKEEVMMNDPKFLRCETLLAALNNHGAQVTVVTAKDKLRNMLSAGLDPASKSLAFSVERAAQPENEQETEKIVGASVQSLMKEAGYSSWPPPTIYDPDISVYCLQLGLALLKKNLALQKGISLPSLSVLDFQFPRVFFWPRWKIRILSVNN